MKRLLALVLLAVAISAGRTAEQPPLDILVIAPHPDDEVIGCAGVMLRALRDGKRVGVVFLTNGDAHAKLAAVTAKNPVESLTADDFLQLGALRQKHALAAARVIGVPEDELVFLGYPDGGLAAMYRDARSSSYRSPQTRMDETNGAARRDYRTTTEGKPAQYTKLNLLSDLRSILLARRPKEIYVTHESDRHGDHQAAFRFALDAVRGAAPDATLLTYVVHGSPPTEAPDVRVILAPADLERKRAAIMEHQKGTSPVHDFLVERYGNPEEWFWRAGVGRVGE